MPPKKAATTTKAPAKKTVTKGPAKKAPAGAAKPKKEEPAKEQPKKEEPPKEVPAKRKTIGQKQIAKVLIEDDDRDIRDYGKAVLVIDNENHIAARFLPYSGANVLEASDPSHMAETRLRAGLMGAVRFGKPLAIDFGECGPDMMESLERKFDDIQKGLLEKVLNRDVCRREIYESLLKDSDEDTMKVESYYDFEGEVSAKYMFMIIVKPMVYPSGFTNQFYTVTVE